MTNNSDSASEDLCICVLRTCVASLQSSSAEWASIRQTASDNMRELRRQMLGIDCATDSDIPRATAQMLADPASVPESSLGRSAVSAAESNRRLDLLLAKGPPAAKLPGALRVADGGCRLGGWGAVE